MLALLGLGGDMRKPGEYVYILQPEKIYSREQGKELLRMKKIPAIISDQVEGRSDVFWVIYYGPPNHFTRPGNDYGKYRKQISEEYLVSREPNLNDPLEF
jgi:hypothetical protein